jgi:hypothetical protein
MSEIIKSVAFILASIILARFALPANITPIIAMAVFLPYITKNKHLQTLLPIGILFLTDIFLGFYGATMLFVYGTLLLISLLSRKSYDGQFTGILKTSGFSVLLWHFIVNFGVYLNGLGTISLAQTYLAAIPFDFRLLVSTLAFSSLFYGCNYAVSCYINKESFSSKPTPLA